MRLRYYPETDSLYIDLSEKPGVDAVEVAEGVVLDLDEHGNVVGIDIDNASRKVELARLLVESFPSEPEVLKKAA